ncbi:MAG: MFS transporter [Dehalococcoidia bacterium]|nr:MAG: MFS transporter [Dehalococcoidia bacterium]
MTDQENPEVGLAPRLARFLLHNKPFIVVWLALFISIAGIAMVSPLLPVFAKDMGASGIWLGLAFSGFALSQIPLMPFVGKFSDRFGKRPFLWIGLLVYAIAAIGYFWSPGYKELVFFRIISGVGSAMVIPTAFAYVGELAPRGHEGRYMGIFNTALIIGFGVGPMLGGIVHDGLGMDATFLSMGVLSCLGFLIAFFFLPGRKPSSEEEGHKEPSTPFATMLKDSNIRGIITFQMAFGSSFGAMLAFLGIYMTSTLDTSLTLVGIAMSVRALQNGALAYPFGWLADRVNRVVLASLGLMVMASGTLSIPWIGTVALLMGIFVVMGTFESMAIPSINAITVNRGRIYGMGSVMGVFNTAMSLGLVAGSLAGGAIEDSFGIEWVFRYAAMLGFVGIVLFNVFMRSGAAESRKDI